ncbi:MAG TPA: SDR family NAD(P)-dependent oxidoreductase [Solirubrobacteraceae bacterium]|nr:SDR family NAD(P)-dependent oxidoreductase [Solirubrobacteraceae bacterium]
MDVRGARVLLTGATGGIGHAIARSLAQAGAQLVLTGRRADVLAPLADELDGASAHTVDLSAPQELQRLIDEAGEIDILVANAALPASGLLESFTIAEIDRALEVNLRAPIVLSRELLPGMVSRGRGHLLYVSSIAGKATAPGSSIYSASKYALRGFAGSLRAELAASNIGVSTVFPGFIRDAGMFADAEVKLPRGMQTRSPEDVARAVLAAIVHNRGEVDVAPLVLRASGVLGSVAPEIAATLARRFGASDVSAQIAAGQTDKR